MEPSPEIAEMTLFPMAAYQSDVSLAPEDPAEEGVDWTRSFLNPAARIETLEPALTPLWEIDGAEPDGAQFWAVPRFARGLSPRRIDVYVGRLDCKSFPSLWPLAAQAMVMVKKSAAVPLDLARHILLALEHWSRQVEDFEQLYLSMPFGSQICIEQVKPDIRQMVIIFTPEYSLERQWLSLAALRSILTVPDHQWPETVDLEEVEFRRQLHDSISIISISKRHGTRQFILKTVTLDVKMLYHELKSLLLMPPNPNIQGKPLYLVTKEVRFGGKRGVCGMIMEHLPLGSLDNLLETQQHSIGLEDRLNWAKQVTDALIHIQNFGDFYADLNLANVGVVGQAAGAPKLMLIDFDHGTGWYNWAPPEINYVSYVERLARGNVVEAVQQEYTALLRTLFPDWSPRKKAIRYYDGFAGYSIQWLALSQSEKQSAMVYMLGKLLWCIFENVEEITEPAVYAAFRVNTPLAFPEFRETPLALRDCIKRCTAGAPEWSGQRQPFVIRRGRLYPRGKAGACGSQVEMAREVRTLALSWWRQEIDTARQLIGSQLSRTPPQGDNGILILASQRPTLIEVLEMIESIPLD
jgi:hypothetical protein